MKSTLTITPATGLSAHVALAQFCAGPNAAGHGTALSFAGGSAAAAQVAVPGARVIDLPGSPPRAAPV